MITLFSNSTSSSLFRSICTFCMLCVWACNCYFVTVLWMVQNSKSYHYVLSDIAKTCNISCQLDLIQTRYISFTAITQRTLRTCANLYIYFLNSDVFKLYFLSQIRAHGTFYYRKDLPFLLWAKNNLSIILSSLLYYSSK